LDGLDLFFLRRGEFFLRFYGQSFISLELPCSEQKLTKVFLASAPVLLGKFDNKNNKNNKNNNFTYHYLLSDALKGPEEFR